MLTVVSAVLLITASPLTAAEFRTCVFFDRGKANVPMEALDNITAVVDHYHEVNAHEVQIAGWCSVNDYEQMGPNCHNITAARIQSLIKVLVDGGDVKLGDIKTFFVDDPLPDDAKNRHVCIGIEDP